MVLGSVCEINQQDWTTEDFPSLLSPRPQIQNKPVLTKINEVDKDKT